MMHSLDGADVGVIVGGAVLILFILWYFFGERGGRQG